MNPSSRRILYVDDDADACQLMELWLQQFNENYGVTAVGTVAKALELISDLAFDLYILDYRMPELSGFELCRLIRQEDSMTPILIYSGMGRDVDLDEALRAGANAYLIKPNDLDKINETVELLLQNKYRAFS